MQNPLTLEERINLTRLIGHDIFSHLQTLITCNEATKVFIENRAQKATDFIQNSTNRAHHITYILKAINAMTQEHTNYESSTIKKIIHKLNNATQIFQKTARMVTSINNQLEEKLEISGDCDILYTAACNFIKNAKKARATQIDINIDQGECPKTTILRYNPNLSNAIAFSFVDNGKGFENIDPKDCFQKGMSTHQSSSNQGLGLYFIDLMCKYLQANLDVKREDNKTKITIYHPTD